MPKSTSEAADSDAPLPNLRLDTMREADLDEVLTIEHLSFSSPWSRANFRHELHENRLALNWVVRQADRMLGYTSMWNLERALNINNIAVHPALRGRGLGSWLLRRILRHAAVLGCAKVLLEVRVSNAAAHRLYLRHGFTEVGRSENYYAAEGEDATLMEIVVDSCVADGGSTGL